MLELLAALSAHPPSPPIDFMKLRDYPRLGCSIASLVLKRTYTIRQIAQAYADCGVTLTSVNLLSAEWPSMKPVHVRPFKAVPEGQRWNLYDWNVEHFDRIDECRSEMNSRGIVVQWCLEELYRWSIRKAHPETPDARNGPFAKAWNTNGVDYVGPHYPSKTSSASKRWDSDMLAKVLPDAWERDYLAHVVPHLDLSHNIMLCGNEFPEKSFHQRVAHAVRDLHHGALVSVNRNEDTPGQYVNMKIGKEFDFINHHGAQLNSPDDLDKTYGGNSNFPTFRHVLKRPFVSPTDKNSVEQWRIIFSSDGARVSDDPIHTYDYGKLGAFAKSVMGYGASFEHQSRVKISGDPAVLETDFLSMLAKEIR